MCSLLNI